ncbi:uncharacterized protein LDX57_011023 [Aspergillus melleus]|uniref:uncharacterized protein n=1 Tax=Aspergillus melleus TaxID=138277 RepID=UPI001E8D5BC3|nr:uncharacterized protein LDX57_011023 [Aspergillus melleus]KAH8433389.1 hypothetical protein LDX57_011023 [Aspergillus melleus]
MRFTFILAILAILHGVHSTAVQGPYDDNVIERFQRKRDDASTAARLKCSFPTLEQSESKQKRAFNEPFDSNRTLVARTMTLPPPNRNSKKAMDEFMRDEIVDVTQKLIWHRMVSGEPEHFDTAIYEEFKDHKSISIGTSGLCGCTVLVIISREAVYMAHYWENISFAPDEDWEKYYRRIGRDIFEESVVRGLRDGIGTKQKKLKPGPFDNDHVQAYLMHPNAPADNFKPDEDRQVIFEEYYERRWNQIKEIVIEIIPAIGQPGRWIDLEYKALDKDSPLLDRTARGHILFKYDPDHRYTDADGTEISQRKATLWVEQNIKPKHDDTWDDEPLS